jgi:hypothetical protein
VERRGDVRLAEVVGQGPALVDHGARRTPPALADRDLGLEGERVHHRHRPRRARQVDDATDERRSLVGAIEHGKRDRRPLQGDPRRLGGSKQPVHAPLQERLPLRRATRDHECAAEVILGPELDLVRLPVSELERASGERYRLVDPGEAVEGELGEPEHHHRLPRVVRLQECRGLQKQRTRALEGARLELDPPREPEQPGAHPVVGALGEGLLDERDGT